MDEPTSRPTTCASTWPAAQCGSCPWAHSTRTPQHPPARNTKSWPRTPSPRKPPTENSPDSPHPSSSPKPSPTGKTGYSWCGSQALKHRDRRNSSIRLLKTWDWQRARIRNVGYSTGVASKKLLRNCVNVSAPTNTFGTAGPNTGAAAFNHAVWQPYSDHWVQLRTWLWRLPTSRPVEWSQDAAYEEIANGQGAATTTTWFARGRHAPPSGRGARHLGRGGRRRAVA
jgi:hypothetical protein